MKIQKPSREYMVGKRNPTRKLQPQPTWLPNESAAEREGTSKSSTSREQFGLLHQLRRRNLRLPAPMKEGMGPKASWKATR